MSLSTYSKYRHLFRDVLMRKAAMLQQRYFEALEKEEPHIRKPKSKPVDYRRRVKELASLIEGYHE